MTAKKRSARDLLLGEFDQNAEMSMLYHVAQVWKSRVRRLLRAHERELAERAVEAADLAFTEGRRLPDGGTVNGMSVRHRASALAAIRAAVLGPQRRRK